MLKELWYLIKLLFSPLQNYKSEIVQLKHFPFQGYLAMSWCGKIITRKPYKISEIDINHERIHLEQALHMGSWINYYWKYLIQWIKGNPIIAPASSAYYTIPFEMEAYANQHKLNYEVTKDSWKKYDIKDRKRTYKDNRDNWYEFCRSL